MEKEYFEKAKSSIKFCFKKVMYPQKVAVFNKQFDNEKNDVKSLVDYTYALTISSHASKERIDEAVSYAKENEKNCDIIHVNYIVLNFAKNGPEYFRAFYNNNLCLMISKAVKRIEKENKSFEQEKINN